MNAEPSLQQLELATGLKELLERSGFTSIKTISDSSVDDIAEILGIESHVAKIIINEAEKLLGQTELLPLKK